MQRTELNRERGDEVSTEDKHLTVAELIAVLSKLPQDAKVYIEGDYGFHQCEGASRINADHVLLEIG
jgi:hypothetical protein